jgi:ABC-type branched-subunit amino acid transport system substrate-binding protein
VVCSAEVEFLIHDDQSDTTLAPALYEKLISEEQIDAVLGPMAPLSPRRWRPSWKSTAR